MKFIISCIKKADSNPSLSDVIVVSLLANALRQTNYRDIIILNASLVDI